MAVRVSAAFYTLPLIIAAMVAAGIAAWALYYRTRGAYSFAAMMGAISWWLCAYTLELTSGQLADAVIWGKLEYLSITTLPPLWLLFALQYSGYERPLGLPARLGLTVIPTLTLLLVGTTEFHHLVWTSMTLGSNGAVQMLVIDHGPWFWVHTLYSYGLILAGCSLLVRTAWRSVALYRAQAVVLMVGALTPVVGNLIYLLNLGPLQNLDLTPFLFTVTGVCLAWGIYRTQLLAVVPVARNQVIEHMGDGVIVLDTRGYVADLNPAGRRLLGARALVGRPFGGLNGSTGPTPDFPNPAQSVPTTTEATIKLDAEELTLLVRATPLRDRRDRPVGQVIVLHDITERKRYERELQEQRELQRALAERAEAGSRSKSAFIATMSHELRTPLAAIIGYSDLVASELAALGQADLVADIEQVSTAGWHLLALVDQVLSLTQIEAGQLRLNIDSVNVVDLLTRAFTAAQPLALPGQNQLISAWDDHLGMIETDPARLLEILQHLLSNACKFTHGGQVVLSAHREPTGAVAPHGEQLVVQVRDTGIGIAAVQIAQIFDQFTQADSSSSRRYGGMGLGLALARGLCELIGGVISVQSTLGKGSTFTVRLPIQAVPVATLHSDLHEV
ncbi:MAG: histidine kinase N-terminal 7TM domain-containing protein [Chloroflexales bacterium]